MNKGIVIYNKAGGYSGYLGNRMFQTAATIGIAMKNGMDYAFPPSDYFNYFKGPIPTAPNLHFKITEEYKEPNYHYNKVVLTPEKNYNLITPEFGFQTQRYWDHCESLIKNIFTFNDEITGTVQKKYAHLLNNPDILLCSLHVRRGDYLKWPLAHPVLPMDYYLDAVNKIQGNKKMVFIIFTNDMTWCKENFSKCEEFKDRLVFAEGNNEAMDMYFMSLCHINVLANSSFSWWAQYLNSNNNKAVIAPAKNRWYGINYAHWNLNDLYNHEWILV